MEIFNTRQYINCRGKLLDLSIQKVMGILNITPDSFYDGGKYSTAESIIAQLEKMIEEGADIIDIGAFSSKPNVDYISVEEEKNRLDFGLNIVRKKYPDIILSVDTFRADVADFAVKNFNVDIINDISSGDLYDKMFETIAKLNVPYIIMHMQGNPQNMQHNPCYTNVASEVIKYLSNKVDRLKLLGVNDIIIDPGFGFGKTLEHNYELMSNLEDFKIFDLPILVGISRKSMIYKALNNTTNESLNGTTVLNTFSLLKGANILRVHDVKEAKEAVKIVARLGIK